MKIKFSKFLFFIILVVSFALIYYGNVTIKVENKSRVEIKNNKLIGPYEKPTSLTNYTREQLQRMVVSTALSYLYNNKYSDYEQLSMDDASTFTWRNFDYSPENVGRSNYYAVDCSSFAQFVYLYTLGYDTLYDADPLVQKYQEQYLTTGKGVSTSVFEKQTRLALDADNLIGSYISDDEISQYVYYYKVNLKSSYSNNTWYNESESDKENVINEILDVLEPGDILVFRRRESASAADYSEKGHSVIYIGDMYHDGEYGFIHASGKVDTATSFASDATFAINPNKLNGRMNLGDDSYSITYSNWDYFLSHYVFETSDSNVNRRSYSFSIIRPINTFCTNDLECHISENDNYSDLLKERIYRNNFDELFENSVTRDKLSNVKIEQYQYKKTTSNVLNKNNSVNVLDVVNYRVNFYNYADDISGIGIEAKIPDDTEYVINSCNNGCTYDADSRTVIWSNLTAEKEKWLSPTYQVRVRKNTTANKIINEGAKVIYNGTSLQLGEMKLLINPTINSENDVNVFKNRINEMVENELEVDFSEYSESEKRAYFLKKIYLDALNIDLSNLQFDHIKDAIFEVDPSYNEGINYRKRITFTSTESERINKMLVPGIYGGTKLRGNYAGDRLSMITKNKTYGSLELGDILITYYLSNNDSADDEMLIWLFCGFNEESKMVFLRMVDDELELFDNNNDGWRVFKEMYSYDLFLLLRPTRVYGTTVMLDYGMGKSTSDVFVAYDTYKNLLDANISGNSTITFKIDNSVVDTMTSSYEFNGWYSDTDLNNKVNNTTNLISTTPHTLYAGYDTNGIILPTYAMDNMTLSGWYDDADMTNFVGNQGDEYKESGSKTLYAKWLTNVSEPTTDKCRNLVYNGLKQNLVYDADTGYTWLSNTEMSAGTYTISAALLDGYIWSDGTTANKTIQCSIEKNTPVIELISSQDSVLINDSINLILSILSPGINMAGNLLVTTDDLDIVTFDYNNQNIEITNDSILATITINAQSIGNANINLQFISADDNYNNSQVITHQVSVISKQLKGDINGNGKIDLNDIITLLKIYLGIINQDANSTMIADMNDNNRIDLYDVISILKIYLGILP